MSLHIKMGWNRSGWPRGLYGHKLFIRERLLSVTWDKCVCSSRHWSEVGQFSSQKVSLLGFHLPVLGTELELEKGWMPTFLGEKKITIFFMLSWGGFWLAWMRENTFSGVPRMHCNVARSSNNTDTYWLRRRPKYSSSYTRIKYQTLSLTLIWTCQVERCHGNYTLCFLLVTFTPSTF